MRLSKPSYYADFVAYPMLIAGLTGVAVWQAHSLSQIGWWACWGLIGFAVWSLLEYILHRFVLHRVPGFAGMHEMHHANPSDLIGSPTWLSVAVDAALFLPLWWATSFQLASGFTVGVMTGYLWYVVIHHAVHHWRLDRGSLLYRAKMRHIHHHRAEQDGNFGVSTPFWDHVFGTVIERPNGQGIASRSA